MITFTNIRKQFPDGTVALDGVSFSVEEGEFLVVLGPSGAGKTTLLRSANGLVRPTSGEVTIDGIVVNQANLSQIRTRVGMIFQQFNLLGNLSVMLNVLSGSLGTHRKWWSSLYLFPKKNRIRALELLDRVGLLDKACRRVDELSGGEQQRVGIARALMQRPQALLADEPIASLDPLIAYNVLSLLREVSREEHLTILCSLHQVDFALRFSERIVGMAGGKIVMDEKTAWLKTEQVQQVYSSHDQGMFFGTDMEQPLDTRFLTWSEVS